MAMNKIGKKGTGLQYLFGHHGFIGTAPTQTDSGQAGQAT